MYLETMNKNINYYTVHSQSVCMQQPGTYWYNYGNIGYRFLGYLQMCTLITYNEVSKWLTSMFA